MLQLVESIIEHHNLSNRIRGAQFQCMHLKENFYTQVSEKIVQDVVKSLRAKEQERLLWEYVS